MNNSYNSIKKNIFFSISLIIGFFILEIYIAICAVLLIIWYMLRKETVYKVDISSDIIVIHEYLKKHCSIKWNEIKSIKIIIEDSDMSKKVKSKFTFLMDFEVEINYLHGEIKRYNVSGLDHPDKCVISLKKAAIKNNVSVQEEFID